MGFNENLKLLLLEKNMKQADLCRMTGIQTSLMSEYINGRKSPTIGNAILIADALNISLDDLVGRKWNTCRDHKKPGAYTVEYTGEYTDELSETLHKLTEKECIFVMDVIKALKQHLQKKKGRGAKPWPYQYIFISFFSGIIFSGTIFLRYRSSMIT